jgi:hypothetical protein
MRSAPRLIHALWVALALLCAQGLGVWHRTAHALPAGPGQFQAQSHSGLQSGFHDHDHDPVPAHAHEHAHGTTAAFDGHEAGDVECRLFDQLLHADGLTAAAPSLLAFGAADSPAAEALRSARLTPAWRQRARGPPGTLRA